MTALRRKLRSQKGLSLPEIMISCLIGLIGISAILSSFLSGRLSSTGAKHWTQAMNVTRARMEGLKSLTYSELAALTGVRVETGVPLDKRDDENSVQCTRYTIVNEEQGGITMGVMVSWREKAVGGFRPWTYQLRTWVSSPGAPIIVP